MTSRHHTADTSSNIVILITFSANHITSERCSLLFSDDMNRNSCDSTTTSENCEQVMKVRNDVVALLKYHVTPE